MARIALKLPTLSSRSVIKAVRSDRIRGVVGQQVYEQIRVAILDCTYLPGLALSEQAVSDNLEVSRAPVREAFRRLATEGLLEVVPQGGTFVARLNVARIRDSIFVREMIECKAAELAAKAPKSERESLLEIVERQRIASAKKNYVQHLSADEALHFRIVEIAGHPNAWGPLRLARTGMNRIRHLAIPEFGSDTIALEQHERVVAAIARSDGSKASAAMRQHIRSPLDYVEALMKKLPEYFVAR